MGGLMTFPHPEDVPVGFSPDCQNVRYRPGSVETRPGLEEMAASITGLNGIAQWIPNASNPKLLIGLASTGFLIVEAAGAFDAFGFPNYLGSGPKFTAGAFMRAQLQFDRLFMGFYITGAVTAGPLCFYDGTYPSATSVQVLSPSGPGAGPTVVNSGVAGNIPAGVHKVAVIFETKDGRYLTEASPEVSWTATGGFKAALSTIPTGPSYVVARRLIFTAVNGADFFYLTTFRIADNTTTAVDIDFSDDTLQRGDNYNQYFDSYRLPDAAGIGFYNKRSVVWGGLNTIKFRNLDFDGGFAAAGEPLGWTQGAAFAGGAKGSVGPFSGEYWTITGDGVGVGPFGEIRKAEAATLLKPNTAYTVSARIRLRDPGGGGFFGDGKLIIDLVGTAVDTTGIEISNPAAAVGADWAEFTGELTSAAGLASIPADLTLRVYYSAGTFFTFGPGKGWDIDRIQIWPTEKKYESSVLRISDTDQPERFDGTSGFQTIKKDNGQRIIAGWEIRGLWYAIKEHSTHVLQDDGVSPPSLWGTKEISSSIGALSPNAVDGSEDMFVVASQAAAFLFRGPSGMELTREITTTWDRINWAAGHTVTTIIDPNNQLVYFLLPLDGADFPTHILILDYNDGWGTDEDPGGRKWSLDRVPNFGLAGVSFNGAILATTSANKREIWLAASRGGGVGSLQHYAGTRDLALGASAGVAIPSYYDTAYRKVGAAKGEDQGAAGGTDLFGGVSLLVSGNGILKTSLRGLDDVIIQQLANARLFVSPGMETALMGNLEAERAKIRVQAGTPSAGVVITTAVRIANEAFINCAAPHGFFAGQTITVVGVGGGFDGSYVVVNGSNLMYFTYANVGADTSISPIGATATPIGLDERFTLKKATLWAMSWAKTRPM